MLTHKLGRLPRMTVKTTLVSRRAVSGEAKVLPYEKEYYVGNTYKHQGELPALPVPALEDTAERWLRSAQPYATPQSPKASAADIEAAEAAWAAAKGNVDAFLKDPVVRELQSRLVRRASENDSWLYDWWCELGYFGWSGPLLEVNYYYAHKTADAPSGTQGTGYGRAARLERSLLDFRTLTQNKVLEPEMARTTPLCMASYRYIFNGSRIPVEPMNEWRSYDPGEANHTVVLRGGRYFKVPVVYPGTQTYLTEADLEAVFKSIVDIVGTKEPALTPIGVLTAGDRTLWAEAYAQLVKDPKNAEILETFHSAINVVALDAAQPGDIEQLSRGLWDNKGDVRNRWYDKSTLIVFDNGKSGASNEHAALDGTPTSRLNEFIARFALTPEKVAEREAEKRPAGVQPPQAEELVLNVPPSVLELADRSLAETHKWSAAHDLVVYEQPAITRDMIKAWGVGPDSFVQLVMGYAGYLLYGRAVPTYEAAQTRKFLLGRTEVLRSVTNETLAFYKSMVDPAVAPADRVALLKAAAKSHAAYGALASNAQGVDRHFFGLKQLLRPGEPVPALFSDPLFQKSSYWQFSTSHLPSDYFAGWGYAEVVPDGFGLAYAANKDNLRFTVTSTNKPPYSAKDLVAKIEQASLEMKALLDAK